MAQEAPSPAVNPHANDPQAAESGRVAFRIYCAPCHGIRAKGGRGPDLTRGTYSSGERDSDLFQTIRNGVPGTEMPASSFSDDIIWRVVAYIRSSTQRDQAVPTGNAASGETLFWGKGGCGACHKVGAKGGTMGPDLNRAGRQRSYAYLRESISSPDADITPGFATITVVTRAGQKITGVQRGFDNFSAQFVDMSGKFYSFDKSEVASIQREFRSLMPGNYGRTLTPAEMNDLLAYLSERKGGR